ncbi:pyridoxal phosphate-dependent decarboxylase family protein [Aliikangiella sp. IMCC44359]|uniref:pyridoxal phosphate-dependent decarboxylase family protein n=1 Tax=Aliikangiella sp. IMCC44359 TaxID=3459125 RepID=UPI00403B0C26
MEPLKADWQKIDSYLKVFSQITRNFLSELDEKNVAEIGSQLKQQPVSSNGKGFNQALEFFCDHIVPQLSAGRGPRYWGFVTGGATPVATFADWLVSTFDQNLSSDGDSIATEVERQTLRWLCQLFDLPDTFDGIVTTGATASNFLGALCARQFAGLQQNINVAKQGAYGLDVDIFSTTPHSSMIKSLGMAGLGQNSVKLVDALPNSEAMDVEHLTQMLEQSSAPGKIIIASVGTVTATDFDDLVTISLLSKKHNAWLHVDAAFGMFERLITGNETKSKGIESADSITLDSHKWLNVPYESGVFLTRHLNILFDNCNVPAPYLTSNVEKPDFMSLGVENSRRFRALPVWMTLLVYGKQGIASWIQSNVNLAKRFAQKINESSEYELILPCQLNVVLFRPNCSGLSQPDADEKTSNFLRMINQDGRLFLSPGKWQGKRIIRAAFSNWETQKEDVNMAMDCLCDIVKNYSDSL